MDVKKIIVYACLIIFLIGSVFLSIAEEEDSFYKIQFKYKDVQYDLNIKQIAETKKIDLNSYPFILL